MNSITAPSKRQQEDGDESSEGDQKPAAMKTKTEDDDEESHELDVVSDEKTRKKDGNDESTEADGGYCSRCEKAFDKKEVVEAKCMGSNHDKIPCKRLAGICYDCISGRPTRSCYICYKCFCRQHQQNPDWYMCGFCEIELCMECYRLDNEKPENERFFRTCAAGCD